MVRAYIGASLLAAALLAGCATRPAPQIAAPVVPIPQPVPMPLPPVGAAANMTIPVRLPDGSYATPNRNPSPAAAMWHLRAALNVAALGCDDAQGQVSASYNRLIAAERKVLAAAHRALEKEHGGMAAFDTAMTRLYNYFAQPAAKAGFCDTARALLAESAVLPAGGFAPFATTAIARIDRPFTDFYASYDSYRTELTAWRAGAAGPPRLAYDPAVFLFDGVTVGQPTRLASR